MSHNNYNRSNNNHNNRTNVKKYQNQHKNQEQQTQKANYDYNILIELKDYMLDNKNIILFTKNIIGVNTSDKNGAKTKLSNVTKATKMVKNPIKIQRDIQ
jgi:hypothetical protein